MGTLAKGSTLISQSCHMGHVGKGQRAQPGAALTYTVEEVQNGGNYSRAQVVYAGRLAWPASQVRGGDEVLPRFLAGSLVQHISPVNIHHHTIK